MLQDRRPAQYSTAQGRAAQHSTAQGSTAQHSTGQHSTAQDRNLNLFMEEGAALTIRNLYEEEARVSIARTPSISKKTS